jgi:hypothetical protein
MTYDNKTKDNNEWKEFLKTGKGGQRAVQLRPKPAVSRVSSKQRAALRRSTNG